ncbi:hypothetical protein CERSUDRAFT_118001 [Gelatoporia subvermispora B]|uniref:Nucleoporin Nup159/Nup146 N-terminal domain-containing protein n=1 Tax=Ceriporiopsis subvermispora (strain B) TaxID=914234 RepID=M2PCJ1_CERS8|nr:hypothetical protein CERSUDRAFT_118001 [Gelatoporia subvermispora B]
MNVSPLQPPAPPQLQRVSKEAEDKDADFLALRLLNKRARVKLSPQPLDSAVFPGQARLFAVANTKGCFAAVTRTGESSYGIVFAPLSALRTAFVSASADNSDTVFHGRRTLQLPAAPMSVQFACNETRVVVGLVQGAILVYDLQAILAKGTAEPSPIHTFSGSTPIREIIPNPGDIPELVAVLRETTNSDDLAIEVLDINSSRLAAGWKRGQLPSQTPVSLSWSPKGKQLAVGLMSGDIAAYAPGDTLTPKSVVPGPPTASGQPILSLTWLSNSEFYSIHVPAGPLAPDVEQNHFVVATDGKANQVADIKVNTPYLPFPGLRNPSPFMVVFRGWAPSKYLIFVGDSSSSDIGLVGNLGDSQDSWHNLSLEETSTPTVPLDKVMNDTILFGLDLDLTATDKFRFTQPSGEESDLPPPPVMYAYASDGTIVGWHIINMQGAAYPGMITPGLATTVAAPVQQQQQQSPPAAMQPEPAPTSAFGQSAFSQARSPPAFGQSAFGAPQSATSPPAPVSGGFGAFAGSTATFGQSGFGFGVRPPAAPAQIAQSVSEDAMATESTSSASTSTATLAPAQPPQIAAVPSADDAMADDAVGGLSLGGLGGLGGAPSDKPNSAFGGGIFGQSSMTPAGSPSQPSAFGGASASSSGGSLLRPATGFGAFANQGPSPFGTGASTSGSTTSAFGGAPAQGQDASKTETKPASAFGTPAFGQPAFGKPAFGQPAFGQSGFGSTTPASSPSTSAFGQPAFGQPAFGKPAFGQSAFGQSGFGAAATTKPASAFSSSSGGGFSAFAQAGPTSFGSALQSGGATPAKPVWAAAQPEKKEVEAPKSAFGQPAITSPAATPRQAEPAPKSSNTVVPTSTAAVPATPPAVIPAPAASTTPATPPAAPSSSAFGAPATPATPSPFMSQAPAPSGGAFGGLKASPFGFGQVQSGFGAFGNKIDTNSSPFFKVAATGKTDAAPVSAFGKSAAATTTPPSTPPQGADASKPVFGAPSALGGKPVFGASSALGAKPSAFGAPIAEAKPAMPGAPASGGFAAFSGTTSAFGAAATPGKSFGELLRQKGGEEKKDEGKAVVKAEPNAKAIVPVKPQEGKAPVGPSGPVSAFSQLPRPVSVFSKPPETPKIKGEKDDRALPRTPASPEASDEEGSDEERDPEEDEHDVRSFLSESFSDSGEEVEGGHAEEEREYPEAVDEPAQIPLPATPTPEASPSGKEKAKEEPQLGIPQISTGELVTTTPPGSPVKIAAPEPVPASTSLQAGLGLGRPSTRPARSSPLAAAPINNEDDDDTAKRARLSATPLPEATLKLPTPTPSPFLTPPPVTPTPTFDTKADAQTNAPKLSLKPSPFAALGQVPPPMPAPFKVPAFSLPAPSPAAGSSSAPTSPFGFPSSPPSTPPQSGSLFAAIKPSPSPPQAQGLLGAKPSFTTPTPSTSAGGAFNWGIGSPDKGKAPAVSTQSSFGPAQPVGPTAGVPAKPVDRAQELKASLAAMAEGMQKECVLLVTAMDVELQEIRTAATEAGRKREALSRPSGGKRTTADLGDADKWAIADAAQFTQAIKAVEKEIEQTKAQRQSYIPVIHVLESDLLKATIRKEEIVRFSKASQDDEFAKMLKTRTLGPEHLETQNQLRREIRSIRDRVQQLEDHIQSSKKKLKEMKSGKAQVKPPSLDTINRTYRNIDLAIDQEADKISELTHRIAKIRLDTPRKGTPTRDARLPDKLSGLYEVTPPVAVSTAAALNAERAARKLKDVLLAARREPLINMQAVDAPSTRTLGEFSASLKADPEHAPPDLFGLVPTPQMAAPAFAADPGWTLPPFDIPASPSPPLGPVHGSRLRVKKHQSAPPIKKAPSVTSPPPPASFDWGPLPNVVSMTPPKGLPIPFDLGRKDSPGSPTPRSLSGSWVTEGFKAK